MIRKRVQALYELTSTVKGHDCADTIGLALEIRLLSFFGKCSFPDYRVSVCGRLGNVCSTACCAYLAGNHSRVLLRLPKNPPYSDQPKGKNHRQRS